MYSPIILKTGSEEIWLAKRFGADLFGGSTPTNLLKEH